MSDMLREMDHGPSALPAGSQLTLFNTSTNVEIMARVKTRNRSALNTMHSFTCMGIKTVAACLHVLRLCSAPGQSSLRDMAEVSAKLLRCSCRLRNVEVQWIYGNPLDYDDLSAKIDVTRCAPPSSSASSIPHHPSAQVSNNMRLSRSCTLPKDPIHRENSRDICCVTGTPPPLCCVIRAGLTPTSMTQMASKSASSATCYGLSLRSCSSSCTSARASQ